VRHFRKSLLRALNKEEKGRRKSRKTKIKETKKNIKVSE
jgi:hypothetical protein